MIGGILVIVGILALVAYSVGSGREFNELLIVWVGGIVALVLVLFLFSPMARWSPRVAYVIFAVLALFVLDRMLRA